MDYLNSEVAIGGRDLFYMYMYLRMKSDWNSHDSDTRDWFVVFFIF
jgi:hypothetical protein